MLNFLSERSIEARLAFIQQNLEAPKIRWNDFSKYYYRNAEDILEACKPLLKATHTMMLIHDEVSEVGGKNYISATVDFFDTDQPDKIISARAAAREADSAKGSDAAQISGKTSSYARKYALNALFLIEDSKDSDEQNGEGRLTNPQHEEKMGDLPKPDWRSLAFCECCGKKIGSITKDGRVYSAAQAVLISEERYGRDVCWRCMARDAKAAAKAAEEKRGKIVDHATSAECEPCDCCGAPVLRGNLIETEYGRVCAECFEREVER